MFSEYIKMQSSDINKEKTLIESCCYGGCYVSELKSEYCCFTQNCLQLCYPGDFDIYRK